MGSLEGQTVAVVGGASGIGFAGASAAAGEGARIFLIGRTRSRLEEAASAIDGAKIAVADATDERSLEQAFASIGTIDHLLLTASSSAAGLGVTVAMAQMPLDAAHRFVEGKFWAQYRAARAALGSLSPDGSIAFTSGVAVRRSLPGHTIVAANNAAIEAAARQLAKETAPIRVNVISPGLTETRAYDHMDDKSRAGFFAHVTANQPIARPARPEEIAQAFLFAMTATYLTGTVIDVDGGFLVQ